MTQTFQMYIDGEWVDGSDGQTMETINPATGKVWARFACTSKEDVERAVIAARRALNEGPWSTMTATQRGKLLYKLADLI